MSPPTPEQALDTRKLPEGHPEGPTQPGPLLRIVAGMLLRTAAKQPQDGGRAGEGREEPGQLILGGLVLTCFYSLPLTTRPTSLLTPSEVLSVLSTYEAFIHGPCTSFFLSGTLFPVSLPLSTPTHFSGFTLDASSSRKSSAPPPSSNPLGRFPLYFQGQPLSSGPQPWP